MSGEKQDFREVIAVNRTRSIAMLEDNMQIPVVHWFDEDGDDCEPPEAKVCVAGSEELGWWVVDLSLYQERVVH